MRSCVAFCGWLVAVVYAVRGCCTGLRLVYGLYGYGYRLLQFTFFTVTFVTFVVVATHGCLVAHGYWFAILRSGCCALVWFPVCYVRVAYVWLLPATPTRLRSRLPRWITLPGLRSRYAVRLWLPLRFYTTRSRLRCRGSARLYRPHTAYRPYRFCPVDSRSGCYLPVVLPFATCPYLRVTYTRGLCRSRLPHRCRLRLPFNVAGCTLRCGCRFTFVAVPLHTAVATRGSYWFLTVLPFSFGYRYGCYPYCYLHVPAFGYGSRTAFLHAFADFATRARCLRLRSHWFAPVYARSHCGCAVLCGYVYACTLRTLPFTLRLLHTVAVTRPQFTLRFPTALRFTTACIYPRYRLYARFGLPVGLLPAVTHTFWLRSATRFPVTPAFIYVLVGCIHTTFWFCGCVWFWFTQSIRLHGFPATHGYYHHRLTFYYATFCLFTGSHARLQLPFAFWVRHTRCIYRIHVAPLFVVAYTCGLPRHTRCVYAFTFIPHAVGFFTALRLPLCGYGSPPLVATHTTRVHHAHRVCWLQYTFPHALHTTCTRSLLRCPGYVYSTTRGCYVCVFVYVCGCTLRSWICVVTLCGSFPLPLRCRAHHIRFTHTILFTRYCHLPALRSRGLVVVPAGYAVDHARLIPVHYVYRSVYGYIRVAPLYHVG